MQGFNTGTLSPWIDARHDIDKYGKGLRLCRNFIVTPYGGLRRRHGTEYMAEAMAGYSRLLSFQPTSEDGFIVEIGNTSVKIYADGVLEDTLTGPWLTAEIPSLQFEQLNDIMFLTQKNHPPYQLSRTNSTWSLDEIDLDYPPFLDFVLDGTTVEVTSEYNGTSTNSVILDTVGASNSSDLTSAAIPATGDWEIDTTLYASNSTLILQRSINGGNTWVTESTIYSVGITTGSVTSGLLRLATNKINNIAELTTTSESTNLSKGIDVTITATNGIFLNGHIGSEFETTHTLSTNETRLLIESSGTSEALIVQGRYLLSTTGLWRGKLTLEKSIDAGATWTTVVVREAFGDRNINYEGSETSKALMRLKYESTGSSASDPHATLEAIDATVSGRVLITGITSSTIATGTVVESVYSEEATEFWKHSAWSDEEGYPSAVCWHEQRVWYGGTKKRPSTLWASATEDFWNFRATTLDDASFSRRVAANEQSDIRWLASKQYLFIGTGGAEWRGSSDSDSGVITPTSFRVSKFSSFGSESLPATLTGSNMLYVQRQGRKIREISYAIESDGYNAADLTLLSLHTTQGGIKDIAYQASQDSILWATTECGRLIGLTYDKSQNVYAWHSHTTKGYYESVATVYESGDEDSIYVVVLRDGTRMIERFQPNQYSAIETLGLQDMLFLDSAVIYDGASTTTMSGLGHLEGETVQVLADNVYAGEFVVTGGAVTLTTAAEKIKAGLSYISLLETMPFNQAGTEGKFKKVSGINVRVWRSVTAEFAPVQSHPVWEKLQQSNRQWTDLDSIPDPESIGCFEDWKMSIHSGHDRDARAAVRIQEPYPLNVLALQPNIEITDNA
tara:strand:+ start:1363 stop:3906 length:2544 start_codon:yes stop_codon:yes gene_type:complete